VKIGQIEESMESYHANNGAYGSTAIKTAKKSLAHFKAYIDGQMFKETAALDIGKKIHSAILEQDLSCFAKMPVDDGRLKAFKEAKDQAETAGKVAMKPKEFELVEMMFRRFLQSKKAVNMLDQGKVEISHYDECPDTGLRLKTRPDVIGDGYLVNYKTAVNCLSFQFSKQIYDFGYHLSAAHEVKVVERVTGMKIKDYFFIVQEKSAPFELKIYRLADDDLARACGIHDQLCIDIDYATKNNLFPGYSDEIEPIGCPEWAASTEEANHEQEPIFDIA